MQNRPEGLVKPDNKRPLMQLLCVVWTKSLGNMFGASMRLISCHKMSTNVYLFFLQSYRHLADYLVVDLTDLDKMQQQSKNELR